MLAHNNIVISRANKKPRGTGVLFCIPVFRELNYGDTMTRRNTDLDATFNGAAPCHCVSVVQFPAKKTSAIQRMFIHFLIEGIPVRGISAAAIHCHQ